MKQSFLTIYNMTRDLLTSSNNNIHIISPGSSSSILASVWAAIFSEGAMSQRTREAFASVLDAKCPIPSSGRQEEATHNSIPSSSQIAEKPSHGSAGRVFIATCSFEQSSCWAWWWARLRKPCQSLIDRQVQLISLNSPKLSKARVGHNRLYLFWVSF